MNKAQEKESGTVDPTQVYENVLMVAGRPVKLTLHILTSFTGRQDVAVKLNDIVVSVGEVNFKRGGRIWYKPHNLSGSIELDRSDKPSSGEHQAIIEDM